jgi:hypothetical protein
VSNDHGPAYEGERTARHPAARTAVAEINAVVVGVLGAALYNPTWLSAIGNAATLRSLWWAFWCCNSSAFPLPQSWVLRRRRLGVERGGPTPGTSRSPAWI